MLYKDYAYFEISNIVKKDGKSVWNRWNIVPAEKVPAFYDKTDYFTSVARHKPYIKEYIDYHGRIKGYDGAIWYDWIVVDVDEIRPDKIKLFIDHLNINHDIPIDYCRIFFSGSKGFHVLIPTSYFGMKPSKLLHKVVGKIVERIADKIVPYDTSLYDKNQVYRLQFTKHSSTGLYKTPIDYNELNLNISSIKDLSRTKRIDFPFPSYPVHISPELIALAKEATEEIAHPNSDYVEEVSENNFPLFQKRCIHSMLDGVGEGKRDETAIRLAAHFRKEGFDLDMVVSIMHSWNRKNNPPMPDESINDKVTSAFRGSYDFGCNDIVMAGKCDTECFLFHK